MSRDANVVQFYGAAPAPDGREMLLVMELMKVRPAAACPRIRDV